MKDWRWSPRLFPLGPHPSVPAATAFAQAHPGWHRQEGGFGVCAKRNCWVDSQEAPAKVAAYFASEPPQTSAGMIADARAANATGRSDEGARIIRALWRDGDLDPSTEALILRNFGATLTRADHKYRADRLLLTPRVSNPPCARRRSLAPTLPPSRPLASPPHEDSYPYGARHDRTAPSQEQYRGSCSLAFRMPGARTALMRPPCCSNWRRSVEALASRTLTVRGGGRAEGRGRTARSRRAAPGVRTL